MLKQWRPHPPVKKLPGFHVRGCFMCVDAGKGDSQVACLLFKSHRSAPKRATISLFQLAKNPNFKVAGIHYLMNNS